MELDTLTSSICFDDILLVPKKSNVNSRKDLSVYSTFGNPKNSAAWINIDNPIMMAPMEFISSDEMIKQIIDFGGIAFIQRYQPIESRVSQLQKLSKEVSKVERLGFAISSEECKDYNFISKILSYGIKIILIDTALGHNEICINAVKNLRSIVDNKIHIMTGNVSSYEAYKDLMDAGADSVRVGIGGGAACTTRITTGHGVPVLSSIIDIFKQIKDDEINGIISDGGIKDTGDIVKALGAGASAVMMGSMFAGHRECDSKKFRGISSQSTQLNMSDGTKKPLHVEGAEGTLWDKGPVENTLNMIVNNLKSGLSYSGAGNLVDFRKNCKYILVSAMSMAESRPRL